MSTKQELYNEGLTLFGQEKYTEAIDKYKEALEQDSEDGEIHLAISMAFDRLKDYENGIEYARSAVNYMPREPLAYTNMSRIFQKMGKIEEAEDAMAISKQLASGTM